MSGLDEAIKRLLRATGKLPSPLQPSDVRKAEGALAQKLNPHDERTFAQLEEQRFSGIRANDMWTRFEIWLLGRLRTTHSYSDFFRDPDSLNRWYSETFGIDVQFSAGAQRDIQKLKDRKLLLNDTDIARALQAREDKDSENRKGRVKR